MKTAELKQILYMTFAIVLFLIGAAAVIYAQVMQCILSYHKFGVIISEHIFIPHWSAWFYFGIIPTAVAAIMMKLD